MSGAPQITITATPSSRQSYLARNLNKVQAQETRTGGRYIAQQRGSEETQMSDTDPYPIPARRGMLIERLGAASLALVAEMLGCRVDELERRYSGESA